jgi:N4-gp56 family major capsid protein
MPSVLNTAVTTGAGYSQQVEATRDVFSAEIWFAALPILKFDQFSTKKTELGVQPGKTIQIPRYGNIKRGGRLTEGVRLQTRGMSMSLQSITVREEGNAVGFSEFLLQTAFYDQLAAASLLLGRDMAVVLDGELRDTAVSGVNTVFAAGRATRVDLVGGVSGDFFDTQLVKDMVETLETANSPKWAGDHYICFLHPHQARGMRDDNDWINASLYSGATQIYTGEIGRYEDVRFVSTTVMPNGANSALDPDTNDFVDIGYVAALESGTAGNQTTIYQSVMFGEYAFGHATALPVELRDNGVEDFGREHGLAWYSIWGQNVLENPNLVIGESA